MHRPIPSLACLIVLHADLWVRAGCSALAVMASSSGVSREREEFMQLVRTEIKRYDDQLAEDQPMSMVFHAGGDDVSPPTATFHSI